MPFDIAAARKDGASDAQIAEHLAKQAGFDIDSAISDGASYGQIAEHLATYKGSPQPVAPPAPAVDPNSSDLVRGFKNYLPQAKETYGGVQTLLGKAIGSEGLTQSGIQNIQEASAAQQATSRDTDSFTDAWNKGIGAVVTDWLPYNIGQGAANLLEAGATSLGGAFLGSAAGPGGTITGGVSGLVAKQLVKKGIKEASEKILQDQGKDAAEAYVAKETADYLASKEGRREVNKYIGATAGVAAGSTFHGTGETTSRAVEENIAQGKAPEDINLARLLPAAAVHSVADFVVDKISLGALDAIGKDASRHLTADVLKRIAVTGAKEVPPEEIQSMAERYGANLSLADADALKEYVNTAAASFAMSVAPGTIGGVRSHLVGNAKEKLDQDIENEIAGGTGTPPATTPAQTPVVDQDIEDLLNNTAEVQSGRRASKTAGASADIPGEPDLAEPAARARTTVRNRVDGAGSDVGTSEVGTNAQPTTLTGGKSQEQILKELPVGEIAEISGVKYRKTDTGFELVKDTQATPPVAKKETTVAKKETEDELITADEIEKERGKREAAKVAAPVKVAKPKKVVFTPEASAYNYINKKSHYGYTAPGDERTAIRYAAFDYADDLYDTIDLKKGVEPTIRAVRAEKNKAQLAKREEMRADLIKRKYTEKEIKAKLSAVKTYGPKSAYLDFMSLKEITELYLANANKRSLEKKGGATRTKHVADRVAFINDLPQRQKDEILKASEKAFRFKVLADITSRGTTATDKRRETARKRALVHLADMNLEQEHTALLKEINEIGDSQVPPSQKAIATKISALETELDAFNRPEAIIKEKLKTKLPRKDKTKLTAELATLNADRDKVISNLAVLKSKMPTRPRVTKLTHLKERLAEVVAELDEKKISKEDLDTEVSEKTVLKEKPQKIEELEDVEDADAVKAEKLDKKPFVKVPKANLKKELDTAISDGADLRTLLNIIGNKKFTYDHPLTNTAEGIARFVKDFDLEATIVYNDALLTDGMFDPKTNTITLYGVDGVYKGSRNIDEVILHEALHYFTDHVTSNKKEYLSSVLQTKGSEAKKAAETALTRLEKNFREARTKLGKKYVIGSLKEFIAETFSNPAFRNDLAKIKNIGVQSSIGKWVATSTPDNLLRSIVRNIVQALGFDKFEYGARLQETLEDVFQIISLPTDDLKSKSVSYSQKVIKDTEEAKDVSLDENDAAYATDIKNKKTSRDVDLDEENKDYATAIKDEVKTSHQIRTMFTTIPGWQNVARLYQNDRYPIKKLQDQLELAGKLISDVTENFNNIYTQIVLATGNAKNLYKQYVADESTKLNAAVGEFAEAMGMDTDKALQYLHKVLEALHEPERRMTKYVLNVPLSKVVRKGEKRSASDRREAIVDALKSKTLSKETAIDLRKELDKMVFAKDAKGNLIYVESQGSSPIPGNKSTDINSEIYSVTGMSNKSVVNITNKYNSHEHKAAIDKVIKSVQKLDKATRHLNKIGNYYSVPVNNFINFYNWDHYIPLKGVIKHSEADEMLDFSGKRLGSELQEATYAWEGRMSVSHNPIIQVMSDATRSALRAGRKDLTQAIKNSLKKNDKNPDGQGIINGEVKDSVPFKARHELSEKYKGKNTIFHYNADGSVDVLEINDDRMLEAIRRTYKTSNPVIDIANKVTSFLGTVHTRYNYNFAPMNFVRDILTNAWTIGAEMGPMEAARFVKAISAQVAQGGISKAMKVSYAYAHNDYARLKQLAKDDPYMRDMVEYIEKGGLVSYLQGFSNKTNFEQLDRQISKNAFDSQWENLNKSLDIWTEMFEISSRSAAYGIKKRSLMNKGLSEAAASTEAAAFTKNLANFEQVGELGKGMGAAFMFFRPSATGAVRAIEALAPAFMNVDSAINRLPPHIRDDEKAVAKFRENFNERKHYARVMASALVGLGGIMYMMSAMTADDDELGRNSTLNDNMSQWTRFARFHTKIPFTDKEVVAQVPWGFGLGALAAIGAQLSSVSLGRQSVKDSLGNTFQILLDSFIPLPVSRMSPTDAPLNFFIDSVMPSFARPIVEFALNKNGLGQDIYNDANRRMGDAYMGGDKIPQIYKDIAIYLANETGGAIDWSPNSIYFLSNSYADGFARVFEEAQGIYDLAADQKEFSPKHDIPLFGSFFGSKANVDSMEFRKLSAKIEDKAGRLKMFELDPEQYARYLADNPMDEYIVESYNNAINGKLRDLQAEANVYRKMTELSQKDKSEILKVIMLEQNVIKRNIIDTYKALGVEP